MTDSIDPPGVVLRMMEGRAALEAGGLMLALPVLRLQARRGNGEPVMVLPGFMADDNSTILLRGYLRSIGYRVFAWGGGVNRGKMLDHLPSTIQRIEQISNGAGQKVRLVGWSRGGIISREVARDRPELVDRVITIGSPVKGGMSVSSISRWVRQETGMHPEQINNLLRERNQRPISVPIRAIYSRTDGVVAWKACIDEKNDDVEHIEIRGSHTGMGTNAEVFRLLPKLLQDDRT